MKGGKERVLFYDSDGEKMTEGNMERLKLGREGRMK